MSWTRTTWAAQAGDVAAPLELVDALSIGIGEFNGRLDRDNLAVSAVTDAKLALNALVDCYMDTTATAVAVNPQQGAVLIDTVGRTLYGEAILYIQAGATFSGTKAYANDMPAVVLLAVDGVVVATATGGVQNAPGAAAAYSCVSLVAMVPVGQGTHSIDLLFNATDDETLSVTDRVLLVEVIHR